MGRVQFLAIILSILVFLTISTTGFNTDMNPLQLRKSAQVTVIMDNKSITYTSKWVTDAHRLILKVPALSQMPTLYNGCEVTSLAMLLSAAHIEKSVFTLARLVPKDPTPLTLGSDGQIISWGDPNIGFVGSITGSSPGYGVYHRPIAKLLDLEDPGQALDLTGDSFAKILAVVASGRPVVVWTTLTFAPVPNLIKWQSPEGPVTATLYEHAVLLVGFDQNDVFVNNPLNGAQAEATPLQGFKNSWIQMGRQAVTIKSLSPSLSAANRQPAQNPQP